MRFAASLVCLAATLFAAPAFAQAAKEASPSALPHSLAGQTVEQTDARLNAESSRFNLGLGFNRGSETPLLPLAPIEKDQLELSWKPGAKWGITLDLTSRSPNDLLPREEVAAGAYYQVTPRFRFGGGVTVSGDSLSRPSASFKDEVSEATVRVESAFSF